MIGAVIRAAKRKSGDLLDWMVFRGDDWETYWMKQHIKGCREGYIWRGGWWCSRRRGQNE